MTHADLVAMIPVVEAEARRKKNGKAVHRGWDMPYPELLRQLLLRTSGRVLRGDASRAARPKEDEFQWMMRFSHGSNRPSCSWNTTFLDDGAKTLAILTFNEFVVGPYPNANDLAPSAREGIYHRLNTHLKPIWKQPSVASRN